MNRRSFLRVIPIALAGATLDPERLLWVPGAKTIFLPTPVMTEAHFAWRAFYASIHVSLDRLNAKDVMTFDRDLSLLNAEQTQRFIDIMNTPAGQPYVSIPRRN